MDGPQSKIFACGPGPEWRHVRVVNAHASLGLSRIEYLMQESEVYHRSHRGYDMLATSMQDFIFWPIIV